MAMCQRSRKHNKLCPVDDIQPLCSTTAWCTLILRDLSEIRYSWSQGQILKVKVTMRIKQKVMFRLYNFLWVSWIAVIVRMVFVYNQWVCNVMTLTQSESHSAHLHYIVSSLYLSRVTWICVILDFIPKVQFYFSLFTACFLMSLMWRIPISSHILTRFWSLFGLCYFCCTSESKRHRGITLSIICLSVRLSAYLFVTLCFCWHQMRSAEHCSFSGFWVI